MSTRCQIITIENGKTVSCHYHHCDGYIKGGVGEELFNSLKDGVIAVSDMMNYKSHEYIDETYTKPLSIGDYSPISAVPSHFGKVIPHLDIEYLYYIDRDTNELYVIDNIFQVCCDIVASGKVGGFCKGLPKSAKQYWDYNSKWTKQNKKLITDDFIAKL